MFVGVAWNCAAELKFLITALLFVCSLATVLQFLPSRFSFSSAADIRLCVSNVSAAAAAEAAPPPQNPPPPPPQHQQDEADSTRSPSWACLRSPSTSSEKLLINASGSHTTPPHRPPLPWPASKSFQDWGYGRVYTVVVVNCTFPSPIGHDGSGGKLLLLASTNGGGDRNLNLTDTVEALIEPPGGSVNLSLYSSPPKYDYLYCGSSLYGNLSPERVREWLAYHVRLFGERSHFVIHDAGGIHAPVMEVLRPWIEKGYVTLHDIRDQERFDGYYHNQFLIVNDCLHRYRFDAKWMFFFDVDEFIFVPRKSTIKSLTDSLSDHTQFTIEQMTMSNKLCLSEDAGKSFRKWGFEKLVYRDVKRGIRRDRKYAVQPRNVFATGVHMSQNFAGKSTYKTEGRIKYYHYHGTISERREPCRQFLNATTTTIDGIPYVMDTTMRGVAPSVKRFELKMIGPRLQKTHQ
ncbi:glycosyltransferase family protein [Actinidia rufa]|uniref:Glycosyltransferase family 92 protein n=1 Tax=Actinidia rufa TaxID=165716 RepID=A0A7J0G5H3_9ERIC|nr:glycosyltransferase family protein [Actinidia rufa]